MTHLVASMWDMAGLNAMFSSEKLIDRLTVWLWSVGLPKDVYLGVEIWGDGKITYVVRMIHPRKGVSGTVCILCPTLPHLRKKGFGHHKAQLKQALGRGWTGDVTWQDLVITEQKEWIDKNN